VGRKVGLFFLNCCRKCGKGEEGNRQKKKGGRVRDSHMPEVSLPFSPVWSVSERRQKWLWLT
jgi:hypothetical protein